MHRAISLSLQEPNMNTRFLLLLPFAAAGPSPSLRPRLPSCRAAAPGQIWRRGGADAAAAAPASLPMEGAAADARERRGEVFKTTGMSRGYHAVFAVTGGYRENRLTAGGGGGGGGNRAIKAPGQ
uniref:Uncharacterized protein n=1 Tax=Oryza sativa subsp. japonica TaxID=39947 RepID=Q84SN4_ORYSJ|nr:hypothetical protein [Oryza sativa Japonica Group]